MTFLHRLASVVRWLFHRNSAEQDLNDELQAFVDMAAADKVRDGAPPTEARRLAVLDLGLQVVLNGTSFADRPKRVSGGRMALLHRLAAIVRWLVHRNRVEQDLNDELQAFVDMALADRMRDGVPPGDARRLAILHLGGVEQTKERVRSARCGAWLDQIARDVRDGLRQVRRNPAFSAIAIATLALGIGVNTAMFSAVDAVLIRPLPYVDADRLVMIWDEMSHIGFPKHFSTPGEWREWRRLNTVFTDIAATEPGQPTLSGDGDPEQVPGRRVTSNVRGIPGVVSAGAISRIPLTANDQTTGYLFAGQPANDARAQDALSRVVSREYFSTVGARLREGRFFDISDRRSQSPAAIVNESFADRQRHLALVQQERRGVDALRARHWRGPGGQRSARDDGTVLQLPPGLRHSRHRSRSHPPRGRNPRECCSRASRLVHRSHDCPAA